MNTPNIRFLAEYSCDDMVTRKCVHEEQQPDNQIRQIQATYVTHAWRSLEGDAESSAIGNQRIKLRPSYTKRSNPIRFNLAVNAAPHARCPPRQSALSADRHNPVPSVLPHCADQGRQ